MWSSRSNDRAPPVERPHVDSRDGRDHRATCLRRGLHRVPPLRDLQRVGSVPMTAMQSVVTPLASHQGPIAQAAAVAAVRWSRTKRMVTAPGTAMGPSPPGRSPGVLKTAGSPTRCTTAAMARGIERCHSAHGVAARAVQCRGHRPGLGPAGNRPGEV